MSAAAVFGLDIERPGIYTCELVFDYPNTPRRVRVPIMGVLPDHGGEDANGPLPRWVRSAARFADDPLTTARSLRPLIERNASESERLGRLSDEAVQAL